MVNVNIKRKLKQFKCLQYFVKVSQVRYARTRLIRVNQGRVRTVPRVDRVILLRNSSSATVDQDTVCLLYTSRCV